MRIQRAVLAGALAVAVVVPIASASPAAALSCVGTSEVIADASQAFAGRIVDARDNHILVEVEEVWKGRPVEEEVWLDVDLVEWTSWADGPSSNIPDGYSSNETWVFAPDEGTVGACSAWKLDDYVRESRPDRPQDPVADGSLQDSGEAVPDTDATLRAVVPLGIGGAVVLVLLAVLVVRRRSVS